MTQKNGGKMSIKQDYLEENFNKILEEGDTIEDVLKSLNSLFTNSKEVTKFIIDHAYECKLSKGDCYYVYVAWDDIYDALNIMGDDFIQKDKEEDEEEDAD